MGKFFTKRYLFFWIYLFILSIGAGGYYAIKHFQLSSPIYNGILLFLVVIPATGISLTKFIDAMVKFNFDKLLEHHKESLKAQYNKREQAKQIARFLSLVRKYVYLIKLVESKPLNEQTVQDIDNINLVVIDLNTQLWELYLILPTDICLKLNTVLTKLDDASELTTNDIIIEIKAHLNTDVREDTSTLSKSDILGVHYYIKKTNRTPADK